MLASTWLDIVIGIDLHFELVPPPMLPVPFPHPFVGLVLDPIGLAAGLAISNAIGMASGGSFKGPVLINLMPANTTGTEAKNFFLLPHFIIPPGAMWAPMVRIPKPTIIPGKAPSLELPIPPPGDAVMITGSKTVHAMGANLCRLGDIALSCSDPIRLPSSVVLAIPKGAPVLVGGPPAVDWMAAAMGLIKCKWVASRLHKLVSRIKNARLRNLLHKGVCFLTGHPVDVATGRVMTDATDFELPGPLPLVFERSYASSWAHRDSPLGHGWSHPLDQAVWLEPGCVVYRAEDGREIEFDTFDLPDHAIRPGGEVFEPINRLTLRSLGRFRWEVETADGIIHELEPIAGDRDPKLARLVRKRTRNGHEITLHYDARARLEWVRDSGGRILRFEHDEAGRLVQVSLPHPTQPGWVPHTRYVYSTEGDLAQVIDPLGNATRYEYMGHLLVRETDRAGLSFYFGYDGNGPGAYCIRTWGDGGIYDHEIDYDKVGRVTYVTDSLGATTTYEMNVGNAVVRVVDPLGGETRHEYDDNLWQTAEIDALGNATRYDHDAQGNVIRVTYADASTITMEYDEKNLPVRLISRTRDAWSWSYDAAGQLLSRTNPLGETTQYQYRAGLLVSILDPAKRKISLEYDSARSLEAVRWPSGASARFVRDGWGRVVKRQTEPGNQRRYHHDVMGRLVAVEEPDGNVRRMAYDGEGFLIEYQDHHRRVRLRRAGFHWLVEREDADDRAQFFHDTEGRLVAVRNELGEVLQIERDACGRPRREVGFDGRATEYRRNLAGWVIEERKPSGAWTKVEHNTTGQVVKRTHSDQTYEAFRYREDGLLEEALTPATRVRWERDALGRVVKEHQGDHWVAFRYGPSGDRVEMMSSLGSATLTPRDLSGKITSISVQASGSIAPDPIWQIDLARDTAGAELERRAPGGLRARTHYDEVGRPASQRVTGPGGALLADLEYQWEPDERLAALNDPATGLTSFTYDARGRLSAAAHADGRIEHRAADPAGNLYRHPERRGRHYTSGGALRDAEGTRYTYDADGSLIEKVEPSGARWSYSWDGAGNLKEVSRPDGQKVSFDYDGLGRRIRKRTAHGVTTWLWSGDVPLHEIGQDRPLITWVFEPESFTPVGKIQADRGYTIVSDHLGTPRAMFDEEGQIAWRAQLDVWGACRTDVMIASCPWRWPGQYEDEETGLYYNRFRYYDPRAGRYISKDPIGIAGGLNAYAYVADPNGSADPLGLARKKVCKDTGPQLEANIEAQLKAAGIPILKQNHPVFDAGIKRGEIDFEVPEAIIEATVSPSGKLDQITKYLTNPSLFNPSNKPIILFAPNYGGAAGRDIENLGVLVVRDYADLLALVK